jgi:Raf kinase inhibitor-like YbhB/YbcL family protein
MRLTLTMWLGVAVPVVALADPPKPATLEVTSPAFAANGDIPSEFTCEGTDTPPPLAWSEVPAGTKSIAIVVEDPDAPKGTFTHWMVTGISPATRSIGGGPLPSGAMAIKNDAGKAGYTGPCPPSGRHRYVFRVFALDAPIHASDRAQLEHAMKGHVLAEGQLVGMYQKQR